MTYGDIKKYTASLADSELMQRAEQAHADLLEAEAGSDWQASCFAGLVVYCDEMGRRGLKRDSSLANLDMNYYIQLVNKETRKVDRQIGPLTKRSCEMVFCHCVNRSDSHKFETYDFDEDFGIKQGWIDAKTKQPLNA